MEGNFKVSRKNAEGKFWQYGNLKKNKFGNYSLGMRATADFKKLVADTTEGEWINFNLFKDEGKKSEGKPAVVTEEIEW